jgi:hypothetical protein
MKVTIVSTGCSAKTALQSIGAIGDDGLTDEQDQLLTAFVGLFIQWLWPALLRVKGSPEAAAAYVAQTVDTLKTMREPGINGQLDDMLELVTAAHRIHQRRLKTSRQGGEP